MESGGKASPHECDVSKQDKVNAVMQEIFGRERVHILVNNAGIAHIGKLENTTEDDFDRVFRVNVKGIYNCMRAAVEHMKAKGGGVILNLASIAAWVGLADRFAYSMSKGAVVAMTIFGCQETTWRTISAATAFRRRVFTRPSSMDICARTIPDASRKCLRSYRGRSPSGAWHSPVKSRPSLFSCARTKPHSSRERTIPSTEAS